MTRCTWLVRNNVPNRLCHNTFRNCNRDDIPTSLRRILLQDSQQTKKQNTRETHTHTIEKKIRIVICINKSYYLDYLRFPNDSPHALTGVKQAATTSLPLVTSHFTHSYEDLDPTAPKHLPQNDGH